MAFVPCPGGAEGVIHFLLDGQDIENTLWFGSELGEVTSADLAALGTALAPWINADFLNNMPIALSSIYLHLRAQDVADGPAFDVNLGPSVGGIEDDPMPNEVTCAISFRTAVGGRGGRGRNYIPALPRSNVLGNDVDSALLSSIVTSYTGLNAAIASTGFVHVVAHRFSGFTIVDGKKVPTPLATGALYPVTSYIFSDNVVDSQRRRGPGRGR